MQPILSISIPACLLMLGLSVLFPVLPFYVRWLGLSEAEAGVLFSIYAAMSVLCAPFWGRFSERRGRKPAVVIGLLGFGLGFGLFGLGSSFSELFAARVLGGLFAAAALPAIFAYAADVSAPEKRSVAMGVVGAAIGLGIIIGPVLGGVVGQYGLRLPFLGSAIIGVLAALYVWLFVKEPEKRSATMVLERRMSLHLAPYLIFAVLLSTARVGFETTIGFFVADEFEFGPRQTGYMLGIIGVFGVAVQGGGLRALARRFSDQRLMLTGTIFMAAGLTAIGMVSNVVQLYLAGATLAIGYALATPTFTALVSRAGDADQGAAQGLNQSAQSLGRVIGPLIFNSVYHFFGGQATYIGAGGLAAIALLWALIFVRPRVRVDGQIAAQGA